MKYLPHILAVNKTLSTLPPETKPYTLDEVYYPGVDISFNHLGKGDRFIRFVDVYNIYDIAAKNGWYYIVQNISQKEIVTLISIWVGYDIVDIISLTKLIPEDRIAKAVSIPIFLSEEGKFYTLYFTLNMPSNSKSTTLLKILKY